MRIWNARTGASIAVLRGHRSSVRSLSIRSDGRMLAALERNGRLGLWRLPRGAAPRFLQAHEGGAMAVRFSPDGSTVATAGDDRTVKIWDVAGGRLVRTLSGSATTLSFSRDGRLLATAGEDRNVWLWDPLSGQVRAVLRGHQKSVRGVQLGPRGRLLASVSADKTLRLWRLSAVASGRRVDGHAAQVNGVSFSPDGRLLATASYDQTVRLWDVSSGRTIRVLRGHRGTVGEASFSPDGKLLATAGNDRTIQLWEVKTGRGRRILHGHQGAVWSVAFHPRGQLLASTSYDGTVRLWEVDTGTPRATLRGHRGMVLGVTFSPDGTLLASSGSDRTIRLWDAATAKLKAVLTEPTSSVRGASFSPDGRRLLSTGSAHSVRLWDLAAKTSRFVRAFPGRVYWLTFHPDGRRIGIPTSEGLGRICPLGAGRCVTLRGHQSEVNYLRFSPKGRLAATTSDDQTVRLWNAESGRPLWRAPLLGRKSGELFTHRGWHRLEGVGNRPALFTPTGTKWRRAVAERARYAEESDRGDLLCLQTHDGALEAWNTAKDRLLYQTALPGLDRILALADRCVSLAAGTLRLHAADGRQTPLEKGVTGVTWDRGQLLVSDARQLTVRSPSGTVRARHRNGGGATAIARVGNHLVLGFADGALERIQADAASEPSGSFFEHLPASPVLRIIAGPTGTVVAGYGNGQVGVWSLKHGTRLAHARLHGPVFHLLLRGHRLHAASDLGQHTTLDLTPYFTPFCQLLRQVWRAAPAVWRDDAPRLAPPPPSHRCAAGR
ncbi:MAG: WD40 repeat domain-containing protein [bacterium]